MSCILNSPGTCARLARRILAFPVQARDCAQTAQFDLPLDYAALTVALYRDNETAFRTRYPYKDLGAPYTDAEIVNATEVELAAPIDDLGNWAALSDGLTYFVHQLAEGEPNERPVYRFAHVFAMYTRLKALEVANINISPNVWGIQ